MKNILFILITVIFTIIFNVDKVFAQGEKDKLLPGTCLPANLKCNYWVSPYGIDEAEPDLSWTITAAESRRGILQTAYQVLVATSPGQLRLNHGDLWNSGKINSEQMLQIKYAGKPLVSNRQCWWKVRIWDEKGRVSRWSTPAQWTMGILNQNDWAARWISAKGAEKYAPVMEPAKTDFLAYRKINWQKRMPAPTDPNFSSMLLRKEFTSAVKPLRCIVHISGLGQYELRVNGKKVGDALFGPGWSSFDKTVLYNTYDISSLINKGANAVGIVLSNGPYNIQPDSVRYVKMLNTYGQLKVIAQIRMEYADGSVKTIGTDDSWKVSPGPVTFMNYYGGEDYDARLEPAGWSSPLYIPGKNWQTAILINNPATLRGLSCAAPPVKAITGLKPVSVHQIDVKTWVYDLGQNTSVMPRITVSGKRGAYLRIIPSELLKKDGTVDRTSATQDGVRPAWWQYTLDGKDHATWFPRFFYQGCRYLQVELFSAAGDHSLPVLENLTGVVVHSSAEPIGRFNCSNQLFNNIYNLVRWAQRSNMMTVLTDCPHREKLPWLEQYHLNGPALRYNFDLNTLFTKAVNDMADAQLDNGLVPNIAPEYFHAGEDWKKNGFRNSPEWGSSFIIVPWQQYLFSGDVSLIRRYYDQMKRYLAFLDATSTGHLLSTGLGDWYDIGPKPAWGSQLTPVSFTASAIYAYDYEIMCKMAGLLNKTQDASRFEERRQVIRRAFNQKFYNQQTGTYATGSNTTCAMPVVFNLVEPQNRERLMKILVDSISGHNNSFTSGEVGYRFLLKSLADNGYSDVVYRMNNQTERPGYGYQIEHGATSLTEKWDAGVGSFGSQNHFMSGQINEWFFNDLVGISPDEVKPAFKNIIIKPAFVNGLDWVNGSYNSVSGLITVNWKRSDGKIFLDVSIPPNTTAIVFIPANRASDITESGKPIAGAAQVTLLRPENNNMVLQVGSGKFHFVTKEHL